MAMEFGLHDLNFDWNSREEHPCSYSLYWPAHRRFHRVLRIVTLNSRDDYDAVGYHSYDGGVEKEGN